MKLPFADGVECQYSRPFLVVGRDDENKKLKLLNASSIKGKEEKALWDSNKVLDNHNPPFPRATFIKIDAIYEVDYFDDLSRMKMSRGLTLETIELQSVLTDCESYINKVMVSYNVEQISALNQLV
jgi:hypothetical protein